jgi:hypothetical protein
LTSCALTGHATFALCRGLTSAPLRSDLAQGLQLGEFMEVVDRVYATVPRRWRRRMEVFVSVVGRPTARSYAPRKRHFGRLMAMLEAVMLSGALTGDVAPQQLDLPVAIHTDARPVD